MTDPNRSVADELESVERLLAALRNPECPPVHSGHDIEALEKRAAALRYDFGLLAYAGRKP